MRPILGQQAMILTYSGQVYPRVSVKCWLGTKRLPLPNGVHGGIATAYLEVAQTALAAWQAEGKAHGDLRVIAIAECANPNQYAAILGWEVMSR